MPNRPRTTLFTVAAVATVLLAGCGDAMDLPERVVGAALPCAATNATSGIWESAPWPPAPACTWLEFAGGTSYEIDHALGRIPGVVLGYISFSADGASSSIAAGDTFLVQAASDTTVIVRNGTEQTFFLKLVLQ